MKKILILVTMFILTACSGMLGIENISKEVLRVPKLDKRVFTNRVTLEKVILESKVLNNDSKLRWKKWLRDIDFSKNNILIHTFYETSICDYDEKLIKKSSKQVDIVFSISKKSNAICRDNPIYYHFAYKVSKKIKRVGIKAFKHDYVVVEMK